MLNKEDLNKLKNTVTEVIDEKVQPQFEKMREEFCQVIEDNVNPQFDEVNKKFDLVDKRFDEVDKRFDKVDKRFDKIEANMVTKSYLDDKIADLEGGLISKLRKEDDKVNRLIEIMRKKSLLADHDVKHLNELQVFPKVR